MLYRPSISKKSSRFVAFAAAASLLAATAPSFGQDIKATPVGTNTDDVTLNTVCRDYKPGELLASTKCEILKGGLLDDALAQKEKNLACLRKVKTFFDDGKVSRDDVVKYGKDRACELLKTLG